MFYYGTIIRDEPGLFRLFEERMSFDVRDEELIGFGIERRIVRKQAR